MNERCESEGVCVPQQAFLSIPSMLICRMTPYKARISRRTVGARQEGSSYIGVVLGNASVLPHTSSRHLHIAFFLGIDVYPNLPVLSDQSITLSLHFFSLRPCQSAR